MLYLLPRLQELTWKVETPAALERCALFLHPGLQVINLEVGAKLPKLDDFLADMSRRTSLKGFSFISPTNLPDAFTDLLGRQDDLEKVVLVAPGALAPGVGRWIASLPRLKQLQLDLTGRSPIAVEGFFDELLPRSGDSTPSSIGSRDSGVFSGEELDFTEIRKSALRLTGDLPRKGSFGKLRKLQLTGEVANIAVFLKHLESDLINLELVIEDPPDNADWQDLSELICERFADSLQSLRITATPSSKFVDLVRSTSRAEPPTGRLSLEKLTNLTSLTRLDIDLPESVVFTPSDIECLARACPSLESARLCPLARFPTPHSPKLTLESLSPLTKQCKRLHTLAAVCNATPASENILRSQEATSNSLLRLHVGHSWIQDPLRISILLSHLMPRLELLKWFQEKNRAGFIETHAKNWQTVSDTLPHLQLLRSVEKSFIKAPVIEPRQMSEKSIDATVETTSRGVLAQVQTADASIQSSPVLVSREVEAIVETSEASVDAVPPSEEVAVEARPVTVSTAVSAMIHPSLNGGVSPFSPTYKSERSPIPHSQTAMYLLSSILGFLSFAYRCSTLPLAFSSRILQLLLSRFPTQKWNTESPGALPKPTKIDDELPAPASESSDPIPLDSFPVRH
ncbi:unnamed protein product [Cyclocybe aegerita]|uniref:Uncharacterized protein n=1 Tax=Cyclocybe aegerita TaxID=1973307 RepID=A0A8S0WFH2_CYCAE|nr:unnamed protein product [Cyclocybe aegerita]